MKGLHVREYKIRKGLLSGKLSADFRCPNKECAATLSCGHDEIGKKDRCPNCGQPFALTKERLSAFLEQEEQNATERERLKLEKEAARREVKREKEELAQQRAAEKQEEWREKEESAQQMAREMEQMQRGVPHGVVEYVEDEVRHEREVRRGQVVSIHVDGSPAVHGCVVALCSLVVPGLGQLVQGKIFMALLMFCSWGLLWLLFPFTFGISGLMAIAIQVFSIIEAVANNAPRRTRVETYHG